MRDQHADRNSQRGQEVKVDSIKVAAQSYVNHTIELEDGLTFLESYPQRSLLSERVHLNRCHFFCRAFLAGCVSDDENLLVNCLVQHELHRFVTHGKVHEVLKHGYNLDCDEVSDHIHRVSCHQTQKDVAELDQLSSEEHQSANEKCLPRVRKQIGVIDRKLAHAQVPTC